MCVLIRDCNPVLVAFTGDITVLKFIQTGPVTLFVPKKELKVVPEQRPIESSTERTPFRVPDDFTAPVKRYIRSRGGSYRNCGRKARYKDPRCNQFRIKHTRHEWSGDLIAI